MDDYVEEAYYSTFFCPVCVDLLINPVTIPCGHTFCTTCLNDYWASGRKIEDYICPKCKKKFRKRPVLVKNPMLDILLKGICGTEAAEDVSCDLCSGRKVKAVKSCLRCQVSYCEEHLQPHYDVPALKKHSLTNPLENLQEKCCYRHEAVMKLFCRTDEKCICFLCGVDQHKGHNIVAAETERAEKQKGLQTQKQKLLQTIQLKEKAADGLQQQLKMNHSSADAAVEHSDQSLKELLHLLEKRVNEVKLQVRSQQKTEELRAKELQDNMQLEITELKKSLAEIDTLSHNEDHVRFLHKCSSLPKITETAASGNISKAPPPFQDIVTATVSKLKSALQDVSLSDPHDPSTAMNKTTANAPQTDAFPAGAWATAPPKQSSTNDWPSLSNLNQQPTTSESIQLQNITFPLQPSDPFNFDTSDLDDVDLHHVLPYSRSLTFDPQSVNFRLSLSKGNTVVRRLSHKQKYLDDPDRFVGASQVLSREVLRGRCFFQVLFKFQDGFGVAVSYPSIIRDNRPESCFGCNKKSWLLECYSNHFELTENNVVSCVTFHEQKFYRSPSKLGIFVDHNAGILAFYLVMRDSHGEYLQPVYNTRVTFTEPLFAGVVLQDINSSAEFL